MAPSTHLIRFCTIKRGRMTSSFTLSAVSGISLIDSSFSICNEMNLGWSLACRGHGDAVAELGITPHHPIAVERVRSQGIGCCTNEHLSANRDADRRDPRRDRRQEARVRS